MARGDFVVEGEKRFVVGGFCPQCNRGDIFEVSKKGDKDMKVKCTDCGVTASGPRGDRLSD